MIYLDSVYKTFEGLFTPVLNSLTLHIKKGDFCILIGSNGSGKSTLLKLITREYNLDISNKDTHQKKPGKIIVNGSVFPVTQDVSLGAIDSMTLLENMSISLLKEPKLKFYRRSKDSITKKLKEIGLEDYIDKPLSTLSGGQKQMVSTCMAVNSGCDILLLDEHTSALDPKRSSELMTYTDKKIKDMSLTTIMITHKMDDAIKYGNKIVMLHMGKIVFTAENEEKRNLKTKDLLELFHKYEDQNLTSNPNYDN